MNITTFAEKPEAPPFNCWECDRACGGREQPAAWAIYDQEGGYWLCDKCYWKSFPIEKVDKSIANNTQEPILE